MNDLLAAPTAATAPATRNPRRAMIGLVVAMAGTILGSSYASAESCQQLWVERNSYYKVGNAGCAYDNEAAVPLSRDVRARISEIVRQERRNGCSD
jgi:hypothetical protein